MLNLNNFYYYIILIRPYIGRLISNKIRLTRKAQVLSEYGIVLALIVAALVAMQLYVRRGLQGRYKSASDYTLRQIHKAMLAKGAYDLPTQYDPYYTESQISTYKESHITQSYFPQGKSSKTINEKNTVWPDADNWRKELPYSDSAER